VRFFYPSGFVCAQTHSTSFNIYLFGIDPGGEIRLEASFPIQTNRLSCVSAQGRVVGFLSNLGDTPRIATITHLDHPGVLAQLRIPDIYFDGMSVRLSLHFPELPYSSC